MGESVGGKSDVIVGGGGLRIGGGGFVIGFGFSKCFFMSIFVFLARVSSRERVSDVDE